MKKVKNTKVKKYKKYKHQKLISFLTISACVIFGLCCLTFAIAIDSPRHIGPQAASDGIICFYIFLYSGGLFIILLICILIVWLCEKYSKESRKHKLNKNKKNKQS
ncbi:MAG: hypothetical protein Ta2E_08670 [Mycoplasmoidaceae bacterium]|nr:MAG: hypothetical protein Ta2E_08670 [Mycoplasmoidaceae bacterium]